MKKTFKKLFAALLAAALVLAMAVPAFAETNAPKGSITISIPARDPITTKIIRITITNDSIKFRIKPIVLKDHTHCHNAGHQ